MTLVPKPYGAGPYGDGPYGYQHVATDLGGATRLGFGISGNLAMVYGLDGATALDFAAWAVLSQAWQPIGACTPGSWTLIPCGGSP
jgi:hypothetical protein